jgi:hypothetical protein
MAHHAKIENGIVTQVIVTCDSDEDTFADRMLAETGETWIRTSYNAATNGFRKNYAGIGYTFDPNRDAFISPKTFDSWILDENTCQWQAPKPYPADDKNYYWDESKFDWIEH